MISFGFGANLYLEMLSFSFSSASCGDNGSFLAVPNISDKCVYNNHVISDCPINRTCRLIAHSTSDFDDRLQFYKIDYFEKINCI